MEQWIVDGRSLVRQRDPAKFDRVEADVKRVLAEVAPELRCFTSKLLQPGQCRFAGDGNGLEFAFDCDEEGRANATGVWHRGTDLTGVFGIIRSGAAGDAAGDAEGQCPNPYAECTADIMWFFKGELVDELRDFTFVAGAGVVPQAAEEGVLGMASGSRATFACDPGFAFREGLPRPSVAGKAVPPEAVVTLHMHLKRITNPLTPAEKLALATQLKDEGNRLIAERDWHAAIGAYQRALDRIASGGVSADAGSDDAEAAARVQRETRALKVSVLHNMAVATMSADSITSAAAERAAGYCTRALQIDPDHAKARYRRAMCLAQSREWAKALDDLNTLQTKQLGDASAIEELRQRIRFERGGGVV
jgi:hypothetical protein